jgi:hypothetical protein
MDSIFPSKSWPMLLGSLLLLATGPEDAASETGENQVRIVPQSEEKYCCCNVM